MIACHALNYWQMLPMLEGIKKYLMHVGDYHIFNYSEYTLVHYILPTCGFPKFSHGLRSFKFQNGTIHCMYPLYETIVMRKNRHLSLAHLRAACAVRIWFSLVRFPTQPRSHYSMLLTYFFYIFSWLFS